MTTNIAITTDDLDGVSDSAVGNSVVVKAGVLVSTATGNTINFASGGSSVYVYGTVASFGANAISMGFGPAPVGGSLTGSNLVAVAEGASVTSNSFSAIQLANGGNTVLNDGTIFSRTASAVRLAGDNCRLINHGEIMSGGTGVLFDATNSNSTSVLHNSGLISSVSSNVGADEIVNRGSISGLVSLLGGDDLVDNDGGIITRKISLGGGDDTLIGGAAREQSMGGTGADNLDFGGGNDIFLAGNDEFSGGDGSDDLDGGDGVDTYDASAITSAIVVRLAELRASGVAIGVDYTVNFENVTGGSAADSIVGDSGRNVLRGGGGLDALSGLEGNDRIFGGSGADTLSGGAGRDVLTGGADADTFVFASTGDAGSGDNFRDIITDFTQGSADRISLASIDADTNLTGDQAFVLIGTKPFDLVAGQLRFTTVAGSQITVVEGDTNGDARADFQITLFGTPVLTSADFVL